MKQQCYLWSIWLTWLALPLLAGVGYYLAGWPGALLILIAGVTFQVLYVRHFPRVSESMGYGSVADVVTETSQAPLSATSVVLYTAGACPFCPLIRTRLVALQEKLGFSFTEIDVTFRPDVVAAKKLRAVPTVEIDGRLHAGNLTSSELLGLLTASPTPAPGTELQVAH